jgi:hypothetical protein
MFYEERKLLYLVTLGYEYEKLGKETQVGHF